ncbi:unnamed protein product [Alopecurus aequalis]
MVMAQKTKEAEITEQDSLLLTRNLLRFAIYNISYIRGLFPEKYFSDKSVPALEMKIKKLMPMDAESRMLIDWMEKGVYDALQKKYLKTLLFCICEKAEGPMIEEYAFAFSYPSKGDQVAMNLSRTGSKKNSATFKSNAAEVTPDQMRNSGCKMVRTLVSLMRTLDQMPDERTILMKLLYYDDVTPDDYEPPLFKGCADNEAINIWNKNPMKMEVGSVNSKHLVLALKVKSVLDPCEGNNVNSEDDNMSLGHESDQDDDFYDTEVRPSEVDHYVVAPNDGNLKGQSGSVSEEDTQDPAHEEEITAQVREWIWSTDISSSNASDVLSNFPDISMEMVEDIVEKLLKDGLLSRASKDSYAVNKVNALYHALPMDYVTIAKLQGKLDGEANQNTIWKLMEKMVQDGYIKDSGNQRLGKAVIHSEASNRKLLEIKKILEVDISEEELGMDTNLGPAEFDRRERPMTDQEMKDGSTNGCFHSVGSDATACSREELWEAEQTVPMQNDPNRISTSMREAAMSLESGVLGQRSRKSLASADVTQGKLTRKPSLLRWRQEEAGKMKLIADMTSERKEMCQLSVEDSTIPVYVKFENLKRLVYVSLQDTITDVVSRASKKMGVMVEDYYIIYCNRYLDLDGTVWSQDILPMSFITPRPRLRGGARLPQQMTWQQPFVDYTHGFGDDLFDLCSIPNYDISIPYDDILVCLDQPGTNICIQLTRMIYRLFKNGVCARTFSSKDILFNHSTGCFSFRPDFEDFEYITIDRLASSMRCLGYMIRRTFRYAPQRVQQGLPVIRILVHGEDKTDVIGQLPDYVAYFVTDLMDITQIVEDAIDDELMEYFLYHIAMKTSLERIYYELGVALHMKCYPGNVEDFEPCMQDLQYPWTPAMSRPPLDGVRSFSKLKHHEKLSLAKFSQHIRHFISHEDIHKSSQKQADALVMLQASRYVYLLAVDLSLRIPVHIRYEQRHPGLYEVPVAVPEGLYSPFSVDRYTAKQIGEF